MERKASILLSLPLLSGAILQAGEPMSLPSGAGMFHPPAGWVRASGPGLVLSGPSRVASEAPRLAMTVADGDPQVTAASLRDGWKRVADGCEIIDDDDEPLGGRVWRRIRVRFAAGPAAFAQTAWVGSVGGRTVVAVLSTPDDGGSGHLAEAAAAVASISARR